MSLVIVIFYKDGLFYRAESDLNDLYSQVRLVSF